MEFVIRRGPLRQNNTNTMSEASTSMLNWCGYHWGLWLHFTSVFQQWECARARLVLVPVHSWFKLHPAKNRFAFSWLDPRHVSTFRETLAHLYHNSDANSNLWVRYPAVHHNTILLLLILILHMRQVGWVCMCTVVQCSAFPACMRSLVYIMFNKMKFSFKNLLFSNNNFWAFCCCCCCLCSEIKAICYRICA